MKQADDSSHALTFDTKKAFNDARMRPYDCKRDTKGKENETHRIAAIWLQASCYTDLN